MDFMMPNPKFEIEIMVLKCEILILDDIFRIEIFEKSKCQILAEFLSHLVLQFSKFRRNLLFLGSIYTIFLKFRLPEYPKILFAKFFFN